MVCLRMSTSADRGRRRQFRLVQTQKHFDGSDRVVHKMRIDLGLQGFHFQIALLLFLQKHLLLQQMELLYHIVELDAEPADFITGFHRRGEQIRFSLFHQLDIPIQLLNRIENIAVQIHADHCQYHCQSGQRQGDQTRPVMRSPRML